MKRSQAAALIDQLREMAARTDRTYTATELGDLLAQFNVAPLEACTGEAHENPAWHDNCPVCMPRWGFVGPAVRVT